MHLCGLKWSHFYIITKKQFFSKTVAFDNLFIGCLSLLFINVAFNLNWSGADKISVNKAKCQL